MCGKLELIIGPMFSGKSTELIRKIRLLNQIGKPILVIKPTIDIRYNQTKITSHNYESADCIVLDTLSQLNESELPKYDTIIVDEGQFFSDLTDTVINWLNNFNINIIIGGLDGDFQRKPFDNILQLIPHSNKCNKLNSLCSVCKDGTEAPFTFRLTESMDKVLVGGSELYIPLCRKHFNEYQNKN